VARGERGKSAAAVRRSGITTGRTVGYRQLYRGYDIAADNREKGFNRGNPVAVCVCARRRNRKTPTLGE